MKCNCQDSEGGKKDDFSYRISSKGILKEVGIFQSISHLEIVITHKI